MTQENKSIDETPSLDTLRRSIQSISDEELNSLISKVRDGRRKLAGGPPPRKKKVTSKSEGVERRKKKTKLSMMSKEELAAEAAELKELQDLLGD